MRRKKDIEEPNIESDRERALRQYAEIRIKSSSEQITELNLSEASYDFSVSTAIMLLVIAIYHILTQNVSLINLSMLVVSIIFFFGAVVEKRESYEPTLTALASEHEIE